MKSWIFQGNPDLFDIDTYLAQNKEVVWTVRQKELATSMKKGDEVFFWRAAGVKKAISGIIAYGFLTDSPKDQADDEASKQLWTTDAKNPIALRVSVHIEKVSLDSKTTLKKDWLENDPICSEMKILKMASATNFSLSEKEARRLRTLVQNTGRDWNEMESIAALWAYVSTLGKGVSKLPGSPVSDTALLIGRAVTGVYNKIMNFRSLDPTDSRDGLSGGGQTDKEVWNRYFDSHNQRIDIEKLKKDYESFWNDSLPAKSQKKSYADFGDAPNDDPHELQQFAAKVRKGQPAFRKNLLKAYGGKCVITGHGPAEVLEAVHILDHAISGINELDNGLLLRGDLHSLFDARLINIDPITFTVVVDTSIRNTPYGELHGRRIANRVDGTQIDPKYLLDRNEQR